MVEIRPAGDADVNDMAKVYVETWRDTYAGTVPDKVLLSMSIGSQATGWTRALRRGSEIVRVAEDPVEGIVGVGSCGANRERNSVHKGEIYTLYVASDYQNQGIGEKLLTGMFSALMGAGFDSALVWVLANNPARFFYEAVGGIRAGERDEKLWGVILYEIAYAWPDLKESVTGDRLLRRANLVGPDG